jgi:hypothetical protein
MIHPLIADCLPRDKDTFRKRERGNGEVYWEEKSEGRDKLIDSLRRRGNNVSHRLTHLTPGGDVRTDWGNEVLEV